MIKIKRALVSVSDKAGIVELGQVLKKYGVQILSTGGTAKALAQNGIPVTEVSEHTGFPEMLDGRVKTLHPKIHGGLLALRENREHMETVAKHSIGLIDMVVVNLYPFEKTVAQPGVTREHAIENIDIGGPSMLRSAAKNAQSVVVVSDPAQYSRVTAELEKNKGSVSRQFSIELGTEVFKKTSAYDGAIYSYLSAQGQQAPAGEKLSLNFVKVQELRYGENPHQKAAFFRDMGTPRGLGAAKQLWGKELSFNNILDLNAALAIVKEFNSPAVVFLKHNNPCGAAQEQDIIKAYKEAWACDKLSAFGGIVGINRGVDLALANAIMKSGFLECVIAPSFAKDALELLKGKKNLRLLELAGLGGDFSQQDYKRVSGGLLIQDSDTARVEEKDLKTVTKKRPTKKQRESLLFAWRIAKHVKSNAIVLCRGTKTVGIGAGQMSRVDSVFISGKKAGKLAANACLASDAFFPKEDAVIQAAKLGVKAIIQPGGSIADEQIIKVCDKSGLVMVFTGMRHFRH